MFTDEKRVGDSLRCPDKPELAQAQKPYDQADLIANMRFTACPPMLDAAHVRRKQPVWVIDKTPHGIRDVVKGVQDCSGVRNIDIINPERGCFSSLAAVRRSKLPGMSIG